MYGHEYEYEYEYEYHGGTCLVLGGGCYTKVFYFSWKKMLVYTYYLQHIFKNQMRMLHLGYKVSFLPLPPLSHFLGFNFDFYIS